MSTNRGIFDNLPHAPTESPFSIAPESPAAAVTSPFMPVGRATSPFVVAEEVPPSKFGRRKGESPFQVADAQEGFGFEPAPFAAVPAEPAPASSPFAIAPPEPANPPAPTSTFAMEPAPAPAPAPSTWAPEPSGAPPGWPAQAAPTPAFAPAPAPAPEPPAAASPPPRGPEQESDSFSIRQLELRAIFGVDREMSPDEIMQRARSLPGIRHIARVSSKDIGAVDAIKQMIAGLGFGNGGIKLYAGSVPIDFIREAGVLLAVQTDGGFAPGVRETLMIVSRELARS